MKKVLGVIVLAVTLAGCATNETANTQMGVAASMIGLIAFVGSVL